MKHPVYLLLLSCCLIAPKVFPQEKVINIWTNEIPGAIDNKNYIENTDSTGGWFKTWRISNPRLDFYPVKPNKNLRTAIIICPGGGYSNLAIAHEGEQVAHWLNSIGVTAFVLKYRLPSDEIMKDKSTGPLQDAQEAIRIVRRNAKAWNIDPNKIGIMGFSAGGHLASTLSTHFMDKVYPTGDSTSARPDFSILIYPVISMDSALTHRGSRNNLLDTSPSEKMVVKFSNELRVNVETPPAFLIHSINDDLVPVENSINYALALKRHKVPCELHVYQKGGHGYGMGRLNDTESNWPESCKLWMKSNGF